MDLLYGVALFIHMIGLINLFGGMVLIQQGGRRLRAATTWEEAQHWYRLLLPTRGMFIGATLLMLASGLYMAWRQWTMETPWIVVGFVVLAVFGVVGAAVVQRRLAAMARSAADRRGAIAEHERHLLVSPGFWSPVFALNGGALGVVWLMTRKPGWIESILVPLVLMVVGAAVGSAVGRVKKPAVHRGEVSAPGGERLAHGRR